MVQSDGDTIAAAQVLGICLGEIDLTLDVGKA
jgi:hypothetical protein